MQKPIFDIRRRGLIKSRAARSHTTHFLLDRAFDDMIDRVTLADHHTIALVGRFRPEWLGFLEKQGARVLLIDPSAIESGDAERLAVDSAIGDALAICSLVISFGLLDHCNDPKLAAFLLGQLLAPEGTLVGSIVGGESLTFLRGILLEMDRSGGQAAARLHPMMDGQSVAALLGDAGFQNTVVDVDRLHVRYRDLPHLVSDLRDMGCSRSLSAPATPIKPSAWRHTTSTMGVKSAEERFDLINFAARKAHG
ncbi:MAG: methyltransferase domain-containing protein [Sphingomicrobium sp.]